MITDVYIAYIILFYLYQSTVNCTIITSTLYSSIGQFLNNFMKTSFNINLISRKNITQLLRALVKPTLMAVEDDLCFKRPFENINITFFKLYKIQYIFAKWFSDKPIVRLVKISLFL